MADQTGNSAEQEAKMSFQISEDLEREKLIDINEIINNAVKYSKDKDEEQLHLNLRRFFELITFKSGISVNLLNQGIRSLLMIQDFPTLAGMSKIDEKTVQIYLKALEEGEESLKHIRLMVVGMFGVGKTCLIRRLRGESIDDVESTVGIDVNVKTCVLNEDGTWINQTHEEIKDSQFDERLTDAMVMSKTKIRMPKSPDPSPKLLEKCKKVLENLRTPGKPYIDTVKEAASKDSYSGRKPTLSIWDFAGQSVYYSTHHFFLSSRSIYLLVLDISRPLVSKVRETEEYKSSFLLEGSMKKDYTCLDAFKFWVTSIFAYTQYRVEGQQYKPTIVLVGTHGDLLEGNTKEKERKKDEYCFEARGHFDNTPVEKLFYPKTFLVSCNKDVDEVFDDLKKNITEIAKDQPYWNSKTPAKWIPLERSIEGEKRKKKELMKFSEVAGADKENEYNLNDEPEIKLFLQMQHFLGNAIYFDAEDLDRTIILNPQWLINIFKKFVTHRPSVPNLGNLRQCWTEYRKTAKLHKDLLDYITKTDENKEKDNKVGADVVRYMEHLDVIAKPCSEKDVNFHIVPCVLKQLTQEEYENKIKHLVNPKDGKSTYVLCFAFKDGCLPSSVFHRLMATYIKNKPIKRRGEELFVYNGFGAFEQTSTKTLCIWYADFIIYARVTLHDKKNDILLTDECIKIRKELSDTITKILQLDQQNNQNMANRIDHFKEHVLCEEAFLNNTLTVLQSTNKISCKAGLYEVEKMELSADCNCSYALKAGHCIHRDMALRYWYKEPAYLKEISEWFEDSVREKKTFLEEIPKDQDFVNISALVEVKEIRELGRLLNIPDVSIQQIRKSDSKSYQSRVLELFQKWKKKDDMPNNGKLKQILYKLKENMEEERQKNELKK